LNAKEIIVLNKFHALSVIILSRHPGLDLVGQQEISVVFGDFNPVDSSVEAESEDSLDYLSQS